MENFVKELTWRGMIHTMMPGTEELLEKEQVTAYLGIDPTADSLHIGHLCGVMMLKHFQRCGHKPLALIGGATGMIGDPSGRTDMRSMMTTEQIQKWFTGTLDTLRMAGCNAVVFQVRPQADAFFPSDLEPWTRFLTGTQGQAPKPYWDPLQFMIDECHARGMELHAWLNPYRVTSNDKEELCKKHMYWKNKGIFRKYNVDICALATHGNPVHPVKEIREQYIKDFHETILLAEKLGAKLRITSNGSFATLTLPEGVTVEDIYRNDENRELLEKFSLDLYASVSDIGDEDTDEDESVEVHPVASPRYTVNDTLYSNQSYLDYLNMQNVWERYKGDGITVAVIDTGIDTDHPEFAGKISNYSYNATEDKIVKDYGNDWSLVEDVQGHGTSVAGVIAASMDGEGIVGIAPNVTLIVIKCECSEDGSFLRSSDLVFGLYYAIERDADVVNMSFRSGVNVFSEALRLAVDSDVICRRRKQCNVRIDISGCRPQLYRCRRTCRRKLGTFCIQSVQIQMLSAKHTAFLRFLPAL